ncbi:MAG: C39 family peptidase [Nanoarchaeota archaeon]
MKIKVPFVKTMKKNRGRGWCGPVALASLLRHYKDKTPLEEVAKKAGTGKKGGTPPRGLAFFCLSNGFKVEYVSEYAEFKINRRGYSKRYRGFIREKERVGEDERFKKKCEKFSGYKFIKKKPTLKLIEKYLNKKRPILLHFNIAVALGSDKFAPHYVVVVGYDKNNFYVHNIFPKNKAYQKISKKVFARAYGSDGMNSPLIVPYK